MRKIKLSVQPLLILCFCTLISGSIVAQTGDQILDGIGETDLIARYLFQNNVKDRSRNNLHGNIHGSQFKFVEDERFGTVLSLTGNSETYISLPAQWLSGQESLSVTGWINLQSAKTGQVIFAFGKNSNHQLYATPTGTENKNGFNTFFKNYADEFVADAPAPTVDKWNHFVVVFDFPNQKLRTYINGELVDEVKNVNIGLDSMFSEHSEGADKAFVGKSLNPDHGFLNARLYDFRIYRVPLNEEQVAMIFNRSRGDGEASAQQKKKAKSDLQQFPNTTPQLYNYWLTGVPDIQVETVAGSLPRLPRRIKGSYSKNIEGPDVRVLWPVPEDNSQVVAPGTYTVTGRVPGTGLQPKAIVTVKEEKNPVAPVRTLEPFGLDQVVLNTDRHGNKTKFAENRDKFITGLAGTNPDDFLYMFRNAFGQEQPAGSDPLGGWDSQETKLRGHATGHYLSALAQAYAGTVYDKQLQATFAAKLDYMVSTLYDLSQISGRPQNPGAPYVSDPTAVPPGTGKAAFDSDLSPEGIRTDYWNWGKGFISAYPPDQFIMLENGAGYGGDDTQIWAPYYTLHKILAGLLDVYEITGNAKALEIVKGMGDWVNARLGRLPTETLFTMWNSYIAGEYGGMNEAMARLSRLTNEPRYLKAAQLFDNIRVFFGDAEHSHGLAKNVDLFRGLHANQHIPQMMGALETYRASGAPEYYRIAENFWTKVTNDYMYSIGGVAGANNPANAESFIAEPATLYENGFSEGGQNETCATYNLLKLSRNLFLFNRQAELMDYYERGLYNHILASVAEGSPANTYHVPLRPGAVKHFSNAGMKGFSCCNGTALESSTKLQNTIYFKSTDNNALFVNLYVPSTLKWTEKQITLTQETAFPKEDYTRLSIEGNGDFDLHVRVPHWAANGFFIKINGRDINVKAVPGSYLRLSRKWKDGDTVELQMPFQFHLEPVMDQQNIASLFYGPVILAAQEPGPRNEWRKVTLNVKDISKSISATAEPLVFKIDGIVFKPFYETYGRHSVYLDVELK